MTVEHLLQANRLNTPYDIQMGQSLEVPISVLNTPVPPYIPQRGRA